MTSTTTVAELFGLAIRAELVSEQLYRRLVALFAYDEELARFWVRYADEEVGHARWLEKLRAGTPAEKLAGPAEAQVLQMANQALQLSVDESLAKVRHLEDAYQLAADVEASEINAVFRFLVDNFTGDSRTRDFLRTQLDTHVGHLTYDLPARFHNIAERRQTLAGRNGL